MKIEHIKIRHFKGIKEVKLELDPQLTVIVGKNGADKTSILDAIGKGLVTINNSTYDYNKDGYIPASQSINNNLKYNNQDDNLIEILFTPIKTDQDSYLYSVQIELNLHPAWQSKIVPTFTRVFKKCQFIITTHSPQVLSTVHSDHIRILTKNEDNTIHVTTPQNTKGRTSNYILESILGASERSHEVDNLIRSV